MQSLRSGGKSQRNTFPRSWRKIWPNKANEKKYRYKLKVYQRTFPDFICGSPTSTETSCQDEENEASPCGATQKEKVQVEKPLIFKGKGQENKKPPMNQGQ